MSSGWYCYFTAYWPKASFNNSYSRNKPHIASCGTHMGIQDKSIQPCWLPAQLLFNILHIQYFGVLKFKTDRFPHVVFSKIMLYHNPCEQIMSLTFYRQGWICRCRYPGLYRYQYQSRAGLRKSWKSVLLLRALLHYNLVSDGVLRTADLARRGNLSDLQNICNFAGDYKKSDYALSLSQS